MRLWSWNLNGAFVLRDDVIKHLANADVDLVLAQEARPNVRRSGFEAVTSAAGDVGVLADERSYFSAILHRGDVKVSPTPAVVPLRDARWDELGVSLPGTIAAATLEVAGLDPVIMISVYCPWSGPGHDWQRGSGLVISEANAHRVVSDIAMLAQIIDSPADHRILVAGDWNILRGYGEDGSDYWAARYSTVFNRMETLGFEYCGPKAPDGGRQADPWPHHELPADSDCVPTFRRRPTPGSATRQLDFVFASTSLAPFVRTKARNGFEEWGPSDHCIVELEVQSATGVHP
jgi:exonuclease III